MADRASTTSLTTFSPSGKLVQIEYALAAVAGGSPSVGIKATNGIVLAAEKKLKSILYDETTISKIEQASKYIGLTYSGMGPDFRLLVSHARRIAEGYYLTYKERMPAPMLVQRLAYTFQEYTQSRGVRPFGVSLLVAGWDEDKPYLFQCDPSGAYFPWKATALGKNHINGKTFLEKRFNDDLELEDAVHTAILALKVHIVRSAAILHDGRFTLRSDTTEWAVFIEGAEESFDGQMTEDNIEIGISKKDEFVKLTPAEIKDYLAAVL